MSFQSKLREVERKINLENAHYEELMLELSLKKKESGRGDFLTSELPPDTLKKGKIQYKCIRFIISIVNKVIPYFN